MGTPPSPLPGPPAPRLGDVWPVPARGSGVAGALRTAAVAAGLLSLAFGLIEGIIGIVRWAFPG